MSKRITSSINGSVIRHVNVHYLNDWFSKEVTFYKKDLSFNVFDQVFQSNKSFYKFLDLKEDSWIHFLD